ncbi:MAG TPA: hypothetical protein VJA26_05070, partial [Gammaproteobacteria bacterium]|nr:hypothetical protein [Gammaproteobacteria bacterium]
MNMYEAIGRTRETYPGRVSEVAQRYERCGTFYERGFADFTESENFLSDAAAAAYPQAMLDLAKSLLATEEESSKAENPEFIRALVTQALASGDPEVLMAAGTLSSPTIGILDQVTAVAFAIAACELGLDCSSESEA